MDETKTKSLDESKERKQKSILRAFGRPAFKTKGGGTITFARQDMNDINEINKMETGKLIKEWKELVWLNEIYGQIDLNELQRIALIEIEFSERLTEEERETLKNWYKKAKDEFEKSDHE